MAAVGFFAVRRTGGRIICALCSGGGVHCGRQAAGACRRHGCGRRSVGVSGLSIGAALYGGGYTYFCRQHRTIRPARLQKAVFSALMHGRFFPAGAEHLSVGSQWAELAAGPVRRGSGSGRGVAARGKAGEVGLSVRSCSGGGIGERLWILHWAGADDGAAADDMPGLQRLSMRGAGRLSGSAGRPDGCGTNGVLCSGIWCRRRRRRACPAAAPAAHGDLRRRSVRRLGSSVRAGCAAHHSMGVSGRRGPVRRAAGKAAAKAICLRKAVRERSPVHTLCPACSSPAGTV